MIKNIPALDSRKVIIFDHKMYTVMSSRNKPNKNLIFFQLLSIFRIPHC